ncbi:isoprenoid synthase domain-containing protein [Suillus clintonianus]|uniref:isoprenoid synthase domain-containing protein n=1 Tax=Suillus clintonianus TaxID=1904413 RepID=UPI001B879CC3|nr:isoprenoid synthase domain-containing protein [Suillus clintonianus]KAG2118380.1 isoprenoid synthase domain-containing protein [Suillus clintonianus]
MSSSSSTPSACSESHTVSVQLPDLLSSCTPFELRANRHCRSVSQASEAWLRDAGLNLGVEWKGIKVGLWAALCYPGADLTQLRLAVDFLSLLVFEQERERGHDGFGCGDGDENEVFDLISDRLSRAAYKSPAWYMRFHRSMRAYRDARQRLNSLDSTCIPDLETYVDLRRNASGLRMVFHLIEYAGGLNLSERASSHPILNKLTDQACDLIAWSEDAVSCAKGMTPSSRLNIVPVLMKDRNCSFGSALTYVGTLVKQSADAFLATERLFAACVDPAVMNDDTRRYVRGLRDCIAGSVNWLYETERYLGTKGNEVRAFGWVFVPVLD